MITALVPAGPMHAPPFTVIDGERREPYDRPERVDVIRAALTESGLGTFAEAGAVGPGDVLRVHDAGMVEYLSVAGADLTEGEAVLPACWPNAAQRRRPGGLKGLKGYYCTDTETPISRDTWEAALASAGCAAAGARMLLDGEPCVYALCRPPGHHAGPGFFGGYCYLNNAAVGAHILAEAGGPVAILDLDYHHGNGTQAIFDERPDVWYGSIHAEPANTYPYYAGYADETGYGEGEGANVNVPLPEGTGEGAYLDAVGSLLAALAEAEPSHIVISLGLDAYVGDPFSTFGLTAEGYGEVGRRIRALGLPVLAVQEGGYCLPELGRLAVRFLTALDRGS